MIRGSLKVTKDVIEIALVSPIRMKLSSVVLKYVVLPQSSISDFLLEECVFVVQEFLSFRFLRFFI